MHRLGGFPRREGLASSWFRVRSPRRVLRFRLLLILSFSYRRKERTLENLAGGDVILSEEEKKEVAHILETHPVKGGRYADDPSTDALLWG